MLNNNFGQIPPKYGQVTVPGVPDSSHIVKTDKSNQEKGYTNPLQKQLSNIVTTALNDVPDIITELKKIKGEKNSNSKLSQQEKAAFIEKLENLNPVEKLHEFQSETS